MPNRLTMPSPFCSSTCHRRCTWSSPPVRIHTTPGPVARPGPIDRTARRRLAFYPLRSRRISQPGDGPKPLGGRHRRTGNPHRRLDCRPAIGRDFPCRDIKTPPASSNLSPAATISCWTIWLKKSCNSSPKASRLSCCAHPSSTACAARL